MEKMFITVCGTSHYYGSKPLHCGTILKLTKEPDNPYDGNAISLSLPSLGTVGYVANSEHTVVEGTLSASAIYDKIDNVAFCEITFKSIEFIVAKILQ